MPSCRQTVVQQKFIQRIPTSNECPKCGQVVLIMHRNRLWEFHSRTFECVNCGFKFEGDIRFAEK